MKTLLGTMLFVMAAQAYAQSLEADLDGNAVALHASEMPARPAAKVASLPEQKKAQRERVAAR